MSSAYIVGNNSHGFENEKLLVTALNDKRLADLTPHLKKFIVQIGEDYALSLDKNTIIKAKIALKELDPETNRKVNPKPDLYIILNQKEFGISTKIGSGNSVHQEKVETFINWMKHNNNIIVSDNSIYDDLRLLIWGDGSLDGTTPVQKNAKGFVIGRYTTKEFKSIYPDKYKKIQYFLTQNAKELIKRALFLGKTNKEVHYFFHGTPINGVWISQKELLDFNLTEPLHNSTFNVGRLSFQIYNADSKGTVSGSRKRGNVQFKYGKLEADTEKIMLLNTSNIGTYEGNLEEFTFGKMLNKEKNHKFWPYLLSKLNMKDNKQYYVVKVDGHKFSKNVNKKVMCKTDNYLIETEAPINKPYLLQNEYQLTEANLDDLGDYKVIPESGISIKRKQSNKYTITKLNIKSFKSAFSPYLHDLDYIAAALVFYSKKDKVSTNYKIAKDLGVSEDEFISFVESKFNITLKSLTDSNSLVLITKHVKQLVKQTIENNTTLKAALFSGKGWFEPPYYINFLYATGELTDQLYTPYIIDNGSGRSKGDYTIIIKPR